MSRPVRAARFLIFAYQGLRHGHPSPCRFQPSCSNYALDAFELRGFWNGLLLTIKRIGRCRPGARWGYDPVPSVDEPVRSLHV